MSSTKAKKKAAASPAAAPEPKKFKMPKLFIARPPPQKFEKALLILVHPDVAQALALAAGLFATVSKESGFGAAVVVELGSPDEDPRLVLIPRATRHLAGILLGDRVQVNSTGQVPFAEKVDVYVEPAEEKAPANDQVKKLLVLAGIVHPGLQLTTKTFTLTVVNVTTKDALAAKLGNLSLEDGPMTVSPPHLCIPQTAVEVVSKKLNIADYPRLPRPVGFDQVGGLAPCIETLRAAVQLPLQHAELFSGFGISPPRGVLLHGPPGTGKSMLLRCVAAETDAHVIYVDGPSIVLKYLGETETAVRELFAEAARFEPAVIFMDEIDLIAPRRSHDDGETEARVVATLLTMLDSIGGRVVVVAATNRPNSVDPALRRPGRFDQEVEVGIPDAAAREDIMTRLVSRMNKCLLTADDILLIALKTHGYVGADLAALCRELVMRAISRCIPASARSLASSISVASADTTMVEMRDVDAALAEIRPSAMREIFLEMPKVYWHEIAGQQELKRKLIEVVQLPLEAAPAFARLGVSAPKGVLLYGPPGCSKTLAAKALATESGLNFLAVKGPELLNKYVGESERALREIFRKARAAAPLIIFFDEVDALASSRDEASTLAAQNVLTSLLNEIDGVEELNGVVVVAATNRPSEIDLALLRPGRLDRHIYVAPPDKSARLDLIKNRCSKFTVADEGLFERMASATDGCSGAEVALLCQEAGLAAIMENAETEVVEERHFEHALAGIARGITPEMLEYYAEFAGRSGLNIDTQPQEDL